MNEIRAYRLILNQTQKQFADLIKVKVRQLQYWEQKDTTPQIVCEYLHKCLSIVSREEVAEKMKEEGSPRAKRVLS